MVYRGAAQPSPEHGVHEEGYPVVVAAREISRLQIIAASDLEIRYESRPGAAWNSGELEDFVGKRATRHFPSGAVLTLTGVEVPPLIERGTPVVIVSEVGGIGLCAGRCPSCRGLGRSSVETPSPNKLCMGNHGCGDSACHGRGSEHEACFSRCHSVLMFSIGAASCSGLPFPLDKGSMFADRKARDVGFSYSDHCGTGASPPNG